MASASESFFVITGASGSGKSSIVDELARRGYSCVDEIGRRVVREQKQSGEDGTPWQNPVRFMELLFARSLQAYAAALALKPPVFFDRALPECLAYARSLDGAARSQALLQISTLRYNPCVFVSSPWEEIYRRDEERIHSFEEGVAYHEAELAAYAECGYSLLEIPRGSVEARATFVIAQALARAA